MRPSGDGSSPSRQLKAICACSDPSMPTAGPLTPAVAQFAAECGKSGNTALTLGARSPQNPPA